MPLVFLHLVPLLLVHPLELVGRGLVPHLGDLEDGVGGPAHPAPHLPGPRPARPHQLVVDGDDVDQVEGEQPEEEAGDPAGELDGAVVVGQELKELPGAAPAPWRGRWGPPPAPWARGS